MFLLGTLLSACSIYEPALLVGPQGSSGAGGANGQGGVNSEASGSANGAVGGEPSVGGSGAGGSGAAPGGGVAGRGAAGLENEAGESSGSGSSARAGRGSENGGRSAASGAGGNPAGASGEAGAGGDAACDAPPGCDCGATGEACALLARSLVHRYSFDGIGTSLLDSRGTLDGLVVGTSLSGIGTLPLSGGPPDSADERQFAELPPDCTQGLVNATFEAWFVWEAGDSLFQRVFDFGEPSTPTTGTSLWFSPWAGGTTTGTSRAAFSGDGTGVQGELIVAGPGLSIGRYAVAVVVDATEGMLLLYLDGEFAGAQSFTGALASVNALHCFLGRSNDATDPYFGGALDEFRIYDAALSADAVALSYDSGPNAVP